MSEQESSPKRGGCLLIFLAIFILYQIGLTLHVLQNSGIYGEALPSPMIQLGFALFWLGLFIWMAWGVVRKKAFALGYTSWLLLSFILFRLWQGIIFAQADYERNRLPFVIVLSVLLLVIPLMRLYLGQSGNKNERG